MRILGIRVSHGPAAACMVVMLVAATFGLCNMAGAIDIGLETPVGSVSAPELANQEVPAIAAWPGGYLAVYKDRRSGTDYDIAGIFLDTSGHPIGGSFVISTSSAGTGQPYDQDVPAIAYNGTNFLVAWTDKRPPYVSTPKLYCARVSTTGTVLDPDGILLYSDTVNPQFYPAVASNGTDWEVVWERYTGLSMDIRGIKVSAAGVPSSSVSIAITSSDETNPSIAWNGTYYVVAYDKIDTYTADDIHISLLNSSGSIYIADTLVWTDTVSGGSHQVNPKVAVGTGGISMVVWQDDRNGSSTGSDIYGSRIGAAGMVFDPQSIPIYVSSGEQELPCISWDGTYFDVAWRDSAVLPAKVNGLRLSSTGVPQDDPCLQLSVTYPSGSTVVRSSALCVAGRTGLSAFLWAVSQNSAIDIYGCTLNTSGVSTPEQVVSLGAADQATYSADFDGTNYVVVWADKRSGKSCVYASRVTPFGQVLDPTGVLLSSSTRDQREPAIRWNGSVYFVSWTEGATTDSDIMGVKLLSDLTVLNSPALTLAALDNAQITPSIAWNGTNFLIAYVDTKYGTLGIQHDIMGALYNPSTGVIHSVPYCSDGLCTPGICTELNDQIAPSAAWNGSNFVVAWQDMRSGTAEVYYSRLDSNGYTVGTANGTKVSTASASKLTPQVAYDGTNCFIVWADSRTDSAGCYNIYGVRMNSSGTRLDATDIPICTQLGSDQSAPSVVWAGDRYFVSWQDARSYTNGVGYDIYLARVNSSGVVQDPGGVFVSSGGYADTEPFLINGGTNWAGILYGKNVYPVHMLQFRYAGDQVPLAVASIAAMRAQPNGRKVSITNQVVSAGTTQLASCFYIEDADRTAGIRVANSTSCDEAGLVDVSGTLATANGERQLINAAVTVWPSTGTVPGPLELTLASLGGTAFNSSIPGVQDGSGLNNIGLLVRAAGQVISTGSGYFMMQDGSNGSSGTPLQVKVVCPAGVTLPTVGKTVGVTGISSCEPSGATYARIILARKNADIKAYN